MESESSMLSPCNVFHAFNRRESYETHLAFSVSKGKLIQRLLDLFRSGFIAGQRKIYCRLVSCFVPLVSLCRKPPVY